MEALVEDRQFEYLYREHRKNVTVRVRVYELDKDHPIRDLFINLYFPEKRLWLQRLILWGIQEHKFIEICNVLDDE